MLICMLIVYLCCEKIFLFMYKMGHLTNDGKYMNMSCECGWLTWAGWKLWRGRAVVPVMFWGVAAAPEFESTPAGNSQGPQALWSGGERQKVREKKQRELGWESSAEGVQKWLYHCSLTFVQWWHQRALDFHSAASSALLAACQQYTLPAFSGKIIPRNANQFYIYIYVPNNRHHCISC